MLNYRYLFVVLLAVSAVACQPYRPSHVSYAPAAAPEDDYPFAYADAQRNTYLRELRERYDLNALTEGLSDDRDRALTIMNWAHRTWKRRRSNGVDPNRALVILNEPDAWGSCRCVEYSAFTAAALSSLGMTTRLVELQKENAADNRTRGGRVVAEVWLADRQKWAMLDPEFNLMPMREEVALNAVELKEALQEKDKVWFATDRRRARLLRRQEYKSFIHPYLFFVGVRFDERKLPNPAAPVTLEGKTRLMLLPEDVEAPNTFERELPLEDYTFTYSRKAFYAEPE